MRKDLVAPIEKGGGITVLSTAPVPLLSGNWKRAWASMTNAGPGLVYLSFGASASAGGTFHALLQPGGNCTIDELHPWNGNVNAKSTDSSTIVYVVDVESR